MNAQSRENRKITNGNGKSIIVRIDPSACLATTAAASEGEVHWTITPYQWKRLLLESDSTAWETEKGATILFSCHPFAADCRYPGRQRANARLIAQAPTMAAEIDLLQDVVAALVLALRQAVLRVEMENSQGNPILSAWLPDARAALRKAEGATS